MSCVMVSNRRSRCSSRFSACALASSRRWRYESARRLSRQMKNSETTDNSTAATASMPIRSTVAARRAMSASPARWSQSRSARLMLSISCSVRRASSMPVACNVRALSLMRIWRERRKRSSSRPTPESTFAMVSPTLTACRMVSVRDGCVDTDTLVVSDLERRKTSARRSRNVLPLLLMTYVTCCSSLLRLTSECTISESLPLRRRSARRS